MNVKEVDKSKSKSKKKKLIVEKHQIKRTPFTIVRIEEDWFLAIADKRVSEFKKTRKEIEDYARNPENQWDLITTLIQVLYNSNK